MKLVRALSVFLLLFIGLGIPNVVFANDNYQQDPKLITCDMRGSNASVSSEVQVNAAKIDLQNEKAFIYYVVTPIQTPNLIANEILSEVETNSHNYNGNFIEVQSYNTPVEITANIPLLQSMEKQFKLQLAVVAVNLNDNSKRVLGNSAWQSPFDAAGYTVQGMNNIANGTFEMYYQLTTGCAVHFGFYPAQADVNGSYPLNAVPNALELIDGSGSALTYLHKNAPGEGRLAFNASEVSVPNNNSVDVFMVIIDSFGNRFIRKSPESRAINFNSPLNRFEGLLYDNGKLSDLTDDALLCKFSLPLTNRGSVSDYTVEMERMNPYAKVVLIPGTDYEVKSSNWGDSWVKLQFTEAGLLKFNGITQWQDWTIKTTVLKPSTISPEVSATETLYAILNYFLLNEADKPEPLDYYYIEMPKVINCSEPNKLQLKVKANTAALNPDRVQYKIYYVVTPADVPDLTSAQIKIEVDSGTSVYATGSQIAASWGAVTEIATTVPVQSGSQRYKVHFAIGVCDLIHQTEIIEPSTARTISFDRLAISSPPVLEKRYSTGYDIKMNTTAPGTIYLGVYPAIYYEGDVYPEDKLPSIDEIIHGNGSGLAYASHQFAQAGTEVVSIHNNRLTPNLRTDIFVVRVDALGNAYMDSEPFIYDANTTGGLTIDQVRYQNNLLNDKTDDQLVLTLSDSYHELGYSSAFTEYLSIGLASNTTTFKKPIMWLEEVTDYRIRTASGNKVLIEITETGLAKFNRSDLFDNGILSVSVSMNQGNHKQQGTRYLDAYTKCRVPLNQSIIQEVDRPEIQFARYMRGDENTLADDYVEVVFQEKPLINPGSAKNYKLEVYETYSNYATGVASLTFSSQDFSVLTSGSSVLLKFSPSGQSKLPKKEFVLWQVSLLESQELEPVPNPQTLSAIFYNGLSLSRELSGIAIGGYPLEGFSPGKTVYEGVPIPYSMAQKWQGDYHQIITVSSKTPQNVRIEHYWGTDEIHCEVPGEWNLYEIRTVVNELSLGTIKLNGVTLNNFSPFGMNFTHKLAVGSPLPVLTAVAEHPDARVQISGSGSLASVYTYVIQVTLGGQTKDYKVNLSYGSTTGETSPKEPKSASGETTSVQTAAQATSSDIEALKVLLTKPDAANGAQLSKSIDAITENTMALINEQKLYENLTRYDDIVKGLSKIAVTKTVANQLVSEVVQLSTVVEQKISALSNPIDALVVVDQYLSALKPFSEQLGQSNLEMEKSVQEMLQKLADRSAVVVVEPKTAAKSITVDEKLLLSAISKQMAVVEQVNQLAAAYFGDTNVNHVSPKLTIAIEKPEAQKELNAVIPKESLSKLDSSGIEKLAVKIDHATLVLNTSELSVKENLVIQMNFGEIAIESSKHQKVVNFDVYSGNERIEQFNKPIELRFEYKDFGISTNEAQSAGIFRLNEVTNQWDAVGGIVDIESGTIFVKRTHLSQYTVMKSKKSFSDVNNSWAEKEIHSLLNKGVIQNADKFEPQSKLTRGEFAAWIAKAYGLEASGKALPFKDLAKSNKNYDAIAAVYEQGLISGKSKSKFEADGFITEQEMAVIMSRTLIAFSDKKSNPKVKSKYLSDLKGKDVANWAQQDMALLMELGINGQKDFAKGNAYVTKETAAAVFSKAYL